MDIHFIMELGQEGQNIGGNGFGSVTCEYLPFLPSLLLSFLLSLRQSFSCTDHVGMEDYCWEVRGAHLPSGVTDTQDIVLDADASVDIGQQRKAGLGSFFNFKVSCNVHMHGRSLSPGSLSSRETR
jgi:hypothetical protein